MRHLFLCLSFLVVCGALASAQSVSQPSPEPVRREYDPFDTLHAHEGTEGDQRLEEIRLKRAQEERRKALAKDTDRLSQLITELKESLAKADPTKVLSLDAVKKAEEIEKVAKRVKNNLREPVQ